jgi:hypothetical protein
MPALLRIESGISAGTSYWIDRAVLRLGSDPTCEVCLPTSELAPHAVTLEFRDGGYRLYNRSPVAVSLDGVNVPAGRATAWPAQSSLDLPGAIRLVLDVDGDPRPCPAPTDRASANAGDFDLHGMSRQSESHAPAKRGPPSAKARSKILAQLGIIVACMAGCALLLALDGKTDEPAARQIAFEEIVASVPYNDAAARPLIQRLQFAQTALVRGRGDEARSRFAELRDGLVRLRDAKTLGDNNPAALVLDYVEMQLGQLQ